MDIVYNGCLLFTRKICNDRGDGSCVWKRKNRPPVCIEVNLTGDATVALFSESQSRFLVTVKAENKEQFENLWTEASQIGSVTNDGKLKVSVNGEPVIEDTVDELHKLWSGAIPKFVAAK